MLALDSEWCMKNIMIHVSPTSERCTFAEKIQTCQNRNSLLINVVQCCAKPKMWWMYKCILQSYVSIPILLHLMWHFCTNYQTIVYMKHYINKILWIYCILSVFFFTQVDEVVCLLIPCGLAVFVILVQTFYWKDHVF